MIGITKLPHEIINPKIGDMIYKNWYTHVYLPCEKCGKLRWARADKDNKPLYPLCFSCARKHPHKPESNIKHKDTLTKLDKTTLNNMHNGLKHRWINPESKEKQRIAMLKKWSDPEYRDNTVGAILTALNKAPNSYEIAIANILDSYFPNEWEFIGNGKIRIGGLNPDFKHKTNNWVIEHFGEYHHGKRNKKIRYHQTYIGRMNILSRYGYKPLILWQYKIDNFTEEEIANEIAEYFGYNIKDKLSSPPHNLQFI